VATLSKLKTFDSVAFLYQKSAFLLIIKNTSTIDNSSCIDLRDIHDPETHRQRAQGSADWLRPRLD
jgi:hypothetical protein